MIPSSSNDSYLQDEEFNPSKEESSSAPLMMRANLSGNYEDPLVEVRSARAKFIRSLSFVAVAVSILAVIIIMRLKSGTFRSIAITGSEKRDPQEFFPQFPTTIRVFENSEFFQNPGLIGDHAWYEVMPLGAGYMKIQNPRQYDMPESQKLCTIPGGDKEGCEDIEVYATASAHQLHCLGILRKELVSFYSGKMATIDFRDHAYHCLDYMRQGVLCAGDTSLEPLKRNWIPSKNQTLYRVDGVGTIHRCRDWTSIAAFTTKHRASDMTGIIDV